MQPAARAGLVLLWLATLLLAGWQIAQRLELSGDLRRFLPDPRTPAQTLLVDELGEGPGARVLMLALSDAPPEELAAQSRHLRARLAVRPEFAAVANGGEAGLEAIPERLRPYRYLLSPTLDEQSYDAAFLADQLQARVQDLASPAAGLLEPLIPADPTLETLRLAESWEPARAPQRLHGVWFDRAGARALLVVETRAAGFDPRGQQATMAALEAEHAAARGDGPGRLLASGPGAFSVDISARTQREATRIGIAGSIFLVLLMGLAYRSLSAPLFGALPLASAALAGLAAVTVAFGSVHGITLAFGFTLIGVAQDYPAHLLSHRHPGASPWQTVRGLWPTLATGVLSTCIAYLTFFAAGVEGLQQLAVFTIAGLAVAALATRFALPAVLPPQPARDAADSVGLQRAWQRIERLPRPRRALALLALAALAAIALAPGGAWQNDLSRLTPVPEQSLVQDAALRAELGVPDARYLLTVEGTDAESALQASERARPALDALVVDGALDGYELAAQYLPSIATQRARQQRLPDRPVLQSALDEALAGSPLRADIFAPFLEDVATARDAAPLRAQDLAGTPLATSVESLLLEREDGAVALVSLRGLRDVDAVERAATAAGAQLLDLKLASESLVASYRERVLAALALAALLLAGTVRIALRSWRRTATVLLPVALSTLVVLAILRLAGVELSLFHLVSLVLAAGLGLDYALFFEHAGSDRRHQLRTLHAIGVCSAMTFTVFALLALSSIPVLRAIGATVALGVAANFLLALLVARGERHGGTATA
jgi:predicted exporter